MATVAYDRDHEYTTEEIISAIPTVPFVVVFGTSHSTGSFYVSEDNALLPVDELWTTKYAKLAGVEVLNLSRPGITPSQMLEVVHDFMYYYNQTEKMCVGAFIEGRYTDFNVATVRHKKATTLNPAIVFSRAFHPHLHKEFPKSLLSNMRHNYNTQVQKVSDKSLRIWLRGSFEFQKYSAYNMMECMQQLWQMTQVLAGIDTKCFYFLRSGIIEPIWEDNYIQTRKTFTDRGLQLIEFDVAKQDSVSRKHDVIQHVAKLYGQDWIAKKEAVCGHLNGEVHTVVANILYDTVEFN